MIEPAVSVQGVSKAYRIWSSPAARLTSPLLSSLARILPGGGFLQERAAASYHDFWALRDINFDVARGDSLGIVGRNGSGKSTLLQIISGILQPTAGQASVRGRVAALLELGSGFSTEFTGRENVYLNGAVLGFSRAQMDERFDRIAAFADIGEFMDQPVKTYSSGMLVRLAFAVQVQVEPDILIVDEALAVGDALFQKRCFQQIERLRSSGTTLIFVSHDQESIRTLTSRSVLLKAGRQYAYGSSSEVLLEYRRQLHEEERAHLERETKRLSAGQASPRTPVADARRSFGDLEAEIRSVRIYDRNEQECNTFYPGDPITIRIECIAHTNLAKLNIGLRIRNKEGIKVYSWGTLNQDISIWSGRKAGSPFWDLNFAAGDMIAVEFRFICTLGLNLYEVQATVSEELDQYYDNQRILHWQDEAAFFHVYIAKHEYFFGGMNDLQMEARLVAPDRAAAP